LDMADNVGRTRLGRQSTAHGSARRELAAYAPPPRRRSRRPKGQHDVEASSSCVQTQSPEHVYVDDEAE
ncbi:hypothetical protein A2U01_0089620, partial [Trifolium medium]|nr:hypothetical protein [Trifolium medium]